MIDPEYRQLATAVARNEVTGPLRERGTQKSLTYGHIAQVLSNVVLPTPEAISDARQLSSVRVVMDLLGDHMKERCDDFLFQNPELHAHIDTTAAERSRMVYGYSLPDAGRVSLHGGIATFIEMESITLATISLHKQRGEQIYMRGLLASQRVPFAFAMQNIARHNPCDDTLFDWSDIDDPCYDKSSTTRHKVMRDSACTMSAVGGLTLTADLGRQRTDARFAGEPTIGCPATLVAGFIRKVHTLAVQSCVQARVLMPDNP